MNTSALFQKIDKLPLNAKLMALEYIESLRKSMSLQQREPAEKDLR